MFDVINSRCKSLLNRKSLLMFDKDDTEIMNFISAAANIRSYIFGIPVQTFFKIKCKTCFLFVVLCK